ncbi:MAG: thiamine pyrophosphate-binding protein [Pseudomonadota bacterium]
MADAATGLRGADIIARKLAAYGCRDAFGIPGGEVLAIMDGLRSAGIDFHLVKHENFGGFMAEGAWHATGAPGILVATVGPGVSNALNAVVNAHQDRVPLIFLTGCMDGAVAHRYTHQVFDHQAVLRPVTKASFRAETGTLGAVMDKALALATEGQPGPVHIDVPIAVAEELTNERYADPHAPALLPVAAPADLAALEAALRLSEGPIAIAGVDAVNDGAGPALTAFCEAWGVPLITTYKGKGLLDERHDLALGGAGLSPKADDILLPALNNADLILLVGYDPIEMRIGWRDPWAPGPMVMEITPVLRTHSMHRVDRTIQAGVTATLAAIGPPDTPRASHPSVAGVKARVEAAFTPGPDWGPATVFKTLRGALPDNTISTADAGAHRILVSQMWQCYTPRTMFQSSALCTMGCSVALAAGHKVKKPEVPAIAFVGDAGLEMILGDLTTLRDMKIPVIICVVCDESLALIEKKQRGMQLPNVGVDFGATDFPAVAEALGGHGQWIDDAASLEAAAADALTRDTFTILACRVPRRSYDGLF